MDRLRDRSGASIDASGCLDRIWTEKATTGHFSTHRADSWICYSETRVSSYNTHDPWRTQSGRVARLPPPLVFPFLPCSDT